MSPPEAAMNARESRELIRLWLLANDGLASDTQLADLNQRIVANAIDRQMLIEMAQQQGWLKWNAVGSDLSEMVVVRNGGRKGAPFSLARSLSPPASPQAERRQGSWRAMGERPWARLVRKGQLISVAWGGVAAVAVACVVGFISGSRAGRYAFRFDDQSPYGVSSSVTGIVPQATMVSSTGCVWGSAQSADWLPADSTLGDSLQLLEGIAEFSVGARADLRLKIEGPTSVVLASQPGASIAYGKIIVSSSSISDRAYPIESPFGRVLVERGAEVGLITFGSNAEIHCFRGKVTIESPWLQPNDLHPTDTSLTAGQSLVFQDVGKAVLQARRGSADKRQFTPQVAMSNDFLSVTSAYIRDVIDSKPVAYWRFEETAGGVVKNEMGPAYQGQVRGTVNWSGPVGNHVIELGLTEDPGSMLVDESWDDVLMGDFSIELWMKPSHHHLGSLVGFVGAFDPKLRQNTHGVLLEIAGPIHFGPSRINRLRFLHRSPLSAVPTEDATCFSQKTYGARRWQHVVATKEGDKLHLFVDGVLVDSTKTTDPTPRGLQLVIGQLYTDSLDRFFVGQLDEIAIYDRALSPSEAARHHDLLRPAARDLDEVL